VEAQVKLRFTERTRQGERNGFNGDAIRIVEPQRLFAVADGHGPLVGDVRPADLVLDELARAIAGGSLADAVRAANRKLWNAIVDEMARLGFFGELDQFAYQFSGPGSTLVAARLDESSVEIAHVGDSRAYLWRSRQLIPLTRDHSLLEDFKAANPGVDFDVRTFPHKHIVTRAIGAHDTVAVELRREAIVPGDLLLLCTGGADLDPQRIAEALGGSLEEAAAAIVRLGDPERDRSALLIAID
jgi:protein phosphatase